MCSEECNEGDSSRQEFPEHSLHIGIFFDGQIFDAYKFATDLIRSAKCSLILIDNYVDESVLLMASLFLVKTIFSAVLSILFRFLP